MFHLIWSSFIFKLPISSSSNPFPPIIRWSGEWGRCALYMSVYLYHLKFDDCDSYCSLIFTSVVGLCFCSIFLNCWNQRGQYGIDLQCSSQLQLHGYMHNFSPQVVCTTTNLQKLRLVAAQIVLDSLQLPLGEILQTMSYMYLVFFFFPPLETQKSPLLLWWGLINKISKIDIWVSQLTM